MNKPIAPCVNNYVGLSKPVNLSGAGGLDCTIMLIDTDGLYIEAFDDKSRLAFGWIYINVENGEKVSIYDNIHRNRYALNIEDCQQTDLLKLFRLLEAVLINSGVPDFVYCFDYAVGHKIALYLLETRGVPYIADNLEQLNLHNHFERWPVVFNAHLLHARSELVATRFLNKNFIKPQLVNDSEVFNADIHFPSATTAPGGPQIREKPSCKSNNLLMVSYFSEPFRAVGTLRNDYWRDVIPEISDFQVDFVTAINPAQRKETKNNLYVPDVGLYSIHIDKRHRQQLLNFQAHSIDILGYTWSLALERYFSTVNHKAYEVVLITGNPFQQFRFASFAKSKWGSKIVLDYRDPYANHPRILHPTETRRLEADFNRQADAIIAVNDVCAKLVETDSREKIHVIANGYDERFFKDDQQPQIHSNVKRIVYAGSLYDRFNVQRVFSQAKKGELEFHVYGRCSDEILHEVELNEAVIIHGVIPYPELCRQLNQYDAGIIFTSGDNFESTTKIYDYIAADLSIIILTDGEVRTGQLHEMTRELDGIHWVKNTLSAIKSIFPGIEISKTRQSDKSRYTRFAGTQDLVCILNQIRETELIHER